MSRPPSRIRLGSSTARTWPIRWLPESSSARHRRANWASASASSRAFRSSACRSCWRLVWGPLGGLGLARPAVPSGSAIFSSRARSVSHWALRWMAARSPASASFPWRMSASSASSSVRRVRARSTSARSCRASLPWPARVKASNLSRNRTSCASCSSRRGRASIASSRRCAFAQVQLDLGDQLGLRALDPGLKGRAEPFELLDPVLVVAGVVRRLAGQVPQLLVQPRVRGDQLREQGQALLQPPEPLAADGGRLVQQGLLQAPGLVEQLCEGAVVLPRPVLAPGHESSGQGLAGVAFLAQDLGPAGQVTDDLLGLPELTGLLSAGQQVQRVHQGLELGPPPGRGALAAQALAQLRQGGLECGGAGGAADLGQGVFGGKPEGQGVGQAVGRCLELVATTALCQQLFVGRDLSAQAAQLGRDPLCRSRDAVGGTAGPGPRSVPGSGPLSRGAPRSGRSGRAASAGPARARPGSRCAAQGGRRSDRGPGARARTGHPRSRPVGPRARDETPRLGQVPGLPGPGADPAARPMRPRRLPFRDQ